MRFMAYLTDLMVELKRRHACLRRDVTDVQALHSRDRGPVSRTLQEWATGRGGKPAARRMPEAAKGYGVGRCGYGPCELLRRKLTAHGY